MAKYKVSYSDSLMLKRTVLRKLMKIIMIIRYTMSANLLLLKKLMISL